MYKAVFLRNGYPFSRIEAGISGIPDGVIRPESITVSRLVGYSRV
jgi:hypothetical protein